MKLKLFAAVFAADFARVFAAPVWVDRPPLRGGLAGGAGWLAGCLFEFSFFGFPERSDLIFGLVSIFCVVSIHFHPKIFLGGDFLPKTKY